MLKGKITSIWLFFNVWMLFPNFVHFFCEAVLFYKQEGVYFANHVMKSENTSSELERCSYCLRQTLCTSVNYKSSGDNEGFCELNEKALKDFPYHGTKNSEYCYNEKMHVQVN